MRKIQQPTKTSQRKRRNTSTRWSTIRTVSSATKRTLISTRKHARDSKTESPRSDHGLKNEMRSRSSRSKCASWLRRRPPSWQKTMNSNVRTSTSKNFSESNNSYSPQQLDPLFQRQSQQALTKSLMLQSWVAFTSILICSKTVLMTPLIHWTSLKEVF